jgi:hypothetical protein
MTGEMLISAAGRVAKAYVAETPGVFRPNWTIEDVANARDAVRDAANPLAFPTVPWGQLDHLRYAFAMASSGSAPAQN